MKNLPSLFFLLHNSKLRLSLTMTPKFKVGDRVRLLKTDPIPGEVMGTIVKCYAYGKKIHNMCYYDVTLDEMHVTQSGYQLTEISRSERELI